MKNWWSQAEGLNALLLMSKIFQGEHKYYDYFIKLLNYINLYFIDHENGGWYEWGTDKNPELKQGLKGQIWKACYHEGRSLMNCVKLISDESYERFKTNEKYRKVKIEADDFIHHWQKAAKNL